MVNAIIFDHDGTLVDSIPVVVEATNAALTMHGRGAAPAAEIVRGMIHATEPRMGLHAGSEDPALQEVLARDFYAAMNRIGPSRATAYPGIAATLAAATVPMAVVTNNQGRFVRGVCEALGLSPHLRIILGAEDMPAPKPDPRGALIAAKACGADPGACAYVGDSITDLKLARAAGMFAVGVTWGTTPLDEMRRLGFDLLIDRPEQLLTLAG